MKIAGIYTRLGEVATAITPGGVVMVESPDKDVVIDLWHRLRSGAKFEEITERLGFGSVASQYIPSFALAVVENGSLHVGLRGAFRACSAAGNVLGTGEGAISWNEAYIDSLDYLVLDRPSNFSESLEVPLADGVTFASSIALTLDKKAANFESVHVADTPLSSLAVAENEKAEEGAKTEEKKENTDQNTPGFEVKRGEAHNLEETRIPLEEPELASIAAEDFFIDSVPGVFAAQVPQSLSGSTENNAILGQNSGNGGKSESAEQSFPTADIPTNVAELSESSVKEAEENSVPKQRNTERENADFQRDIEPGIAPLTQENSSQEQEEQRAKHPEIHSENSHGTNTGIDPVGTGELSLADIRRGFSLQAPPRLLSPLLDTSEISLPGSDPLNEETQQFSSEDPKDNGIPPVNQVASPENNVKTEGETSGDEIETMQSAAQSLSYENSDTGENNQEHRELSEVEIDEGETVIASRAEELRAHIARNSSRALVWGLRCQYGHVNPVVPGLCRMCKSPLEGQAQLYPRPVLGEVWVSTGLNIPLDADIVVGRKPSASSQPDRPRAHLVPVPSPSQQISRTHCEIRIENWDVLLLDKDSNNGTYVIRAGNPPLRVKPHEPFYLQVGDVIDIGEDISLHMLGSRQGV